MPVTSSSTAAAQPIVSKPQGAGSATLETLLKERIAALKNQPTTTLEHKGKEQHILAIRRAEKVLGDYQAGIELTQAFIPQDSFGIVLKIRVEQAHLKAAKDIVSGSPIPIALESSRKAFALTSKLSQYLSQQQESVTVDVFGHETVRKPLKRYY